MKTILRYFLINFVSLWTTIELVKGVRYSGGWETLALGALVFALINFMLVPLLKILLLPLNLITLGLFSWLTNVLALYALTTILPKFTLVPYYFPGFKYEGFTIPPHLLSAFWVAVVASFLIGAVTHFLHWLIN